MKKAKKQNNKYCWHYTTGEKFQAISESGAIYTEGKTTPVQIPGLINAVWFSTNQKWEPTATKAEMDGAGGMKQFSFGRMRQLGGGLVRFGISADSSFLMTWDEWKRKCKCSVGIIEGMEQTALSQGSNVKNFRACLSDVPRELWEVVDVWENGKWVRVFTRDEEASAAA
ncbi:hypothetical protein PDESU_05665 [Pontiella desulfatans]|uniref:Uncharacterized protein n=1 Tax=Pontiella desulfatans TaxID=2750659 RepID=A0A6C2UAJ2_PONDE|nr:hypothetical protein [Pontiella desulfatans]VGO17070.1 hypothetical protein PDESU_05665 [Pontiella desulfatans]